MPNVPAAQGAPQSGPCHPKSHTQPPTMVTTRLCFQAGHTQDYKEQTFLLRYKRVRKNQFFESFLPSVQVPCEVQLRSPHCSSSHAAPTQFPWQRQRPTTQVPCPEQSPGVHSGSCTHSTDDTGRAQRYVSGCRPFVLLLQKHEHNR